MQLMSCLGRTHRRRFQRLEGTPRRGVNAVRHFLTTIYLSSDLSWRRHLFRGKCCARFYFCLLAYHHQDFRIQWVLLPRHWRIIAKKTKCFPANARAQLLTVPPYAMTAVVITLTSWFSDRLLTRGPFVMASTAIGGIGYVCVR